jgi:hypothetical protein
MLFPQKQQNRKARFVKNFLRAVKRKSSVENFYFYAHTSGWIKFKTIETSIENNFRRALVYAIMPRLLRFFDRILYLLSLSRI